MGLSLSQTPLVLFSMPDHSAHLVATSILAERSLQIVILASYVSPGAASSLKALNLILSFSKLCAIESIQSFEKPRSI